MSWLFWIVPSGCRWVDNIQLKFHISFIQSICWLFFRFGSVYNNSTKNNWDMTVLLSPKWRMSRLVFNFALHFQIWLLHSKRINGNMSRKIWWLREWVSNEKLSINRKNMQHEIYDILDILYRVSLHDCMYRLRENYDQLKFKILPVH